MQIRKLAYFILRVVCLFYISQSCFAATYDKIVVFGDSLSDNGNIYKLTVDANMASSAMPIVPKTPPYYEGRFTNGPIWIEILAQSLNIPLVDYAYGGSWVESYKESGQLIPFSLSTQVDYYMVAAAADFNKAKHLYAIWSGNNDYINGRSDPDYASTNTVNIIQNELEWLIYVGGKHFLVFNLSELDTLPGVVAQGPDIVDQVSRSTALHNAKLVSMIEKEKTKYPDVTFTLIDIQAQNKEVIKHASDYNIKNTTTSCYGGEYFYRNARINSEAMKAMADMKMNISNNLGLRTAVLNGLAGRDADVCDNPDEYFYWDRVHPTRVIHEAVAKYVLGIIQNA